MSAGTRENEGEQPKIEHFMKTTTLAIHLQR